MTTFVGIVLTIGFILGLIYSLLWVWLYIRGWSRVTFYIHPWSPYSRWVKQLVDREVVQFSLLDAVKWEINNGEE